MSRTEATFPTRTELVRSRLKDFFAHHTPWHRRLWSIGTCLGVHEIIEYADACISGEVQSTEGLKFVVETARREIVRDPGVAPLVSELDRCLGQLAAESPTKIPRPARDELDQLARRVDSSYRANWCDAPLEVPIEFTAAPSPRIFSTPDSAPIISIGGSRPLALI